MLLKFVRKDTFDSVALVRFTDFSNSFGDVVVLLSRFKESESNLKSIIGSVNSISLTTFSRDVILAAYNNSVSSNSNETINMDTERELVQVILSDTLIYNTMSSQYATHQ